MQLTYVSGAPSSLKQSEAAPSRSSTKQDVQLKTLEDRKEGPTLEVEQLRQSNKSGHPTSIASTFLNVNDKVHSEENKEISISDQAPDDYS